MKIGITGAYGFLGANVVSQCLRQNHEVVAFSSKTAVHPLFDNSQVEVRTLDILDAHSVRNACRGLDAVIHLAGAVDFLASRRRRVWDINVLGSANLYDAVLSLGISKLVDTSSITALGPSPDGRLMDEASGNPYQKLNPILFADAKEALAAVDSSMRGDYGFLTRSRLMYFDSKLAATELSRRYAQHRGLPVIRIFPGTAVGPGDLHYSISQLVDSVWQGKLGMTYPGGTAFMDSRDFARGVVLALDRGTPGDEYILAGKPEDNLSYVDFMTLIASTARSGGSLAAKKRPPVVLPAIVARPASRLLEKLAPGLGLTYGMSLSACIHHRFSSAKAMRELGYSPDTALTDSINACREFSLRFHGLTLKHGD